MYDPALGRFHTQDPLMEWHFNTTPYHYVFNNPINFIDPFGLDTAKHITPSGDPTFLIPELTVTGQKPPGWLRKTLRKIGQAIRSVDQALQGDSEPYRETEVDDGIDMDWYESEEPYGNQNVISPDNPNYDKIFEDKNRSRSNRSNNNSSQSSGTQNNPTSSNPQGTSDNNVNPNNTTDRSGQPIGREGDSVVTEVQVHYYYGSPEEADTFYYRMYKHRKGRMNGRYMSDTLKKVIEK